MVYEKMKVAELREVCKERGLQCYTHGHKLTKSELIESLVAYDIEREKEESKERVAEENKKKEKVEGESRKGSSKGFVGEFAETFDEIIRKYGHRKPKRVYDTELVPGAWVVHAQKVKTKSGLVVNKLRRSRVCEVYREDEEVVVDTVIGTQEILVFDDLLYIKKDDSYQYPMDIKRAIERQRRWRDEK